MIDVTYRVIADHVRCLTFALTDGAIPDNEGRGYVLRRILRRAVRYGRQYLNMHEPFMCDLVAPLVGHMADAFPELRTAHGNKNVEHVTELIRDEEESFLRTLDRGTILFKNAVVRAFARAASVHQMGLGGKRYLIQTETFRFRHTLPSEQIEKFTFDVTTRFTVHKGDVTNPIEMFEGSDIDRTYIANYCGGTAKISGSDAFKMHDTYGFPIDLTEQMAEERGLTVDIGQYERLMEEARDRARQAMKSTVMATAESPEDATDDSYKYDTRKMRATIRAYVSPTSEHGQLRPGSCLRKGNTAEVWVDKTCFYAEQGGQVGDTGFMVSETGRFRVKRTQWAGQAVAHIGVVEEGEIYPAQDVELQIDDDRSATMQNHTSTHVLNWALREVLGEHVQQKGSLVDPEKTRFDFSNRSPMTDEQITQVEQLCREQIDADHQVFTQVVEQAEAREINTLRAVFGEKYPDRVRVVSVGADIDEMLDDPKNEKWMKHSVEFCGGTHLQRSSEAERFVLISEEGVAKGVRRVVGISGDKADAAVTLGEAMVAEVNARVKNPGDDLAEWMTTFQKNLDEAEIPVVMRHRIRDGLVELQKIVKQRGKKQDAAAGGAVMDVVATLLESAEEVGGVTVVVGEVPQAPPDQVRGAIDWVRQKCDASAVLLAVAGDGRVTLLAGMSKKAVERGLKAGDLIREIAPIVGGKGGGKPDLAQGGGKDPSKIAEALEQAKSWLKSKLASD